MKDIIITPGRIRLELYILFASFVIAELVNIHAIIKYDTPWSEIFSQIGFVLILTAIIYVVHWLVRLIVLLCSGIVRKIAGRR